MDPQFVEALEALATSIALGLVGLLATLVTTGLVSVRKKIVAWLDAKAASAGSAAHYEAFKCVTSKLEVFSKNAVAEVEQTLVRQLKENNDWDTASAIRARDAAVGVVKRHLGEQGMAELSDCTGHARTAIEGMIRTYIEKHVAGQKSSKRTAGSPVAPLGGE